MWFHCFIPTSTYLFFRFKFLFHREQLDLCTRHALFQSKFRAHQSTTTCAQCYFNFNVSSIDLWPFLSSRTLERRSILYTQQRNHHHHHFFLQIFLFLSTLFLPILHYHFSWGNGEEIINCVFLWRALLICSKRWSPSTAPNSLLPIACSSLSLPICTLSSNE